MSSIFSIMSDVVSGIGSVGSTVVTGLVKVLTSAENIKECEEFIDDCKYDKWGNQVGSAVGSYFGYGQMGSSAGSMIGDALCGQDITWTDALTFIGSAVGAYYGGATGSQIGGQIGSMVGGLIDGEDENEDWSEEDIAYIASACQQAYTIRRDAVTDCMLSVGYGFLSLYTSKSITKMQNEIADRQLKIAEQLHDHAKKFWNAEDAFLEEAFGLKKECPQYTSMGNQWGKILDDDMDEGFEDYLRFMEMNCLPVSLCQQNHWEAMAGLYRTDTMNFALRQAETKAEALNDLRYAMQYSALGLGKGVLKDVLGYTDVAGQMALNIAGFYNDLLNFGFNLPRDTSRVPGYRYPDQPYAPAPTFTPPAVTETQPPTTSRMGSAPPATTSRGGSVNK